MQETDILVDLAPAVGFGNGDPVIRCVVRDIEQNRVELLSATAAGPGVVHVAVPLQVTLTSTEPNPGMSNLKCAGSVGNTVFITLPVMTMSPLRKAAAARGELRVEPGHRIEGMAEDVAAITFADGRAVLRGLAEQRLQLRPVRHERRRARCRHSRNCRRPATSRRDCRNRRRGRRRSRSPLRRRRHRAATAAGVFALAGMSDFMRTAISNSRPIRP